MKILDNDLDQARALADELGGGAEEQYDESRNRNHHRRFTIDYVGQPIIPATEVNAKLVFICLSRGSTYF